MLNKIKIVGLALFLIGNAVCSTLFAASASASAADCTTQLPPLECARGYYSYQSGKSQGCTQTCPAGTVSTTSGFQCIKIKSGGVCPTGYIFAGISAAAPCLPSTALTISGTSTFAPCEKKNETRCGNNANKCSATCSSYTWRAGMPCEATGSATELTSSISVYNPDGVTCTYTVKSNSAATPESYQPLIITTPVLSTPSVSVTQSSQSGSQQLQDMGDTGPKLIDLTFKEEPAELADGAPDITDVTDWGQLVRYGLNALKNLKNMFPKKIQISSQPTDSETGDMTEFGQEMEEFGQAGEAGAVGGDDAAAVGGEAAAVAADFGELIDDGLEALAMLAEVAVV